jgi:Glycosyltransferases involved in cell wall biogenesis
MPRVSAAIITHNRAHFLPDAIESILGQTFRDLELIVVDDGSTDGTREAIAPYLDRIRYIRREHGGKAVARNTAVQLATGDFIAFCDSDDFWYADRLERQLDALIGTPEAGMVHGHVEIIDERGQPLPDRTAEQRALFSAAHREGPTYASYAFNCYCLSSTILVRREVFESVGLYDCDLPIEDYDFYLRLLLEFDVLFLEGHALAHYRVHDEATRTDVLGAGQIRTAEKHLALLGGATRDSPTRASARPVTSIS